MYEFLFSILFSVIKKYKLYTVKNI